MDQTDCARIQTNRQGMELALVQARLALAEGEVPVGAVVVDQAGRVLAQARNATGALGDPMAHGELLALQKAQVGRGKARLTGCTLYVTLEPCAMCAGAIYWANIGRVVYGMTERRLLQLTGSNEQNPTFDLPCREVFARGQRKIEVIGPFPELEEEAAAVHAGYWT